MQRPRGRVGVYQMAWGWPWGKHSRDGKAFVEQKQHGGWGFIGVYGQGEAIWTGSDYGSLCREGFMRNPVSYGRNWVTGPIRRRVDLASS